jgi:hypothetical protein
MAQTAYEKRLVWAARLLKDVIATLGMDAATVWWRNHHAAIKQNLAAVQREWNEEKRRLRPSKESDA